MCLFNDAYHPRSISFHIKWRHVKTEWGVSGREGEREKEVDQGSERQRVGENQKGSGFGNDC
jgi:hypothetical protein